MIRCMKLCCAAAVLVVASMLCGGTAASIAAQRIFLTVGANAASCEIDFRMPGVRTQASCQSVLTSRHPMSAELSTSGSTKVCSGETCMGNPPENAITLAIGDTVALGPFRCTVLASGVRCIVVSNGRGFLLGARGVTRI